MTGKSPDAFRTISEVADDLDIKQHVLRFWESKFPQIKPVKRAGGRRYYRPDDVALLSRIRDLLYREGYTIKGVQKLLKDHGPRALTSGAQLGTPAEAAPMGDLFATAPAPELPFDREPAKGGVKDDAGERAPTGGQGGVTAQLRGILIDLREMRALLKSA